MREHSRSDSVAATDENIPRYNRFECASENSGSESYPASNHFGAPGNDSTSNLSCSSSSVPRVGENPHLVPCFSQEDPAGGLRRTRAGNAPGVCYQQTAAFPSVNLRNEASTNFSPALYPDTSLPNQDPLCGCATYPTPHSRYRCPATLPVDRQSVYLMEKASEAKQATKNWHACTENETCRNSMNNNIRPGNASVSQQQENTPVSESESLLPPSISPYSSLLLKNPTGSIDDGELTSSSPSTIFVMPSSEQDNSSVAPVPSGQNSGVVTASPEQENSSVAPAGNFLAVSANRSIRAVDSSSFASGRNLSVPSLSDCSVDSLQIQCRASGENHGECSTKTSSVTTPDDSSVAFAPHCIVASGGHFSSEVSELCGRSEHSIAACSNNSVLQNDSTIPSEDDATMVPRVNSDAAFEMSYNSTSFEDSTVASPESSCEFPAAESPEDVTNLDLRRTRRITKRKREFFEFCPICGITVRLPELQAHFAKEVDGLARIPRNLKKPRREDKGTDKSFTQVKNNRENRLAAKVAQYASRARSEVQCPACSLRISGAVQDINKHVLNCLTQEDNSDEFLVVDNDDDDDESFEEYEIGNETRVRAVSFVPGGYNSLQGRTKKHHSSEEDEDLNVDVDDTIAFGQPQYTELDVIPGATLDDKELKELLQLRRAVLENSNAQPHVLESRKWNNHEDMKKANETSSESEDQMFSEVNAPGLILEENEEKEKNSPHPDHVVSSLKEKNQRLGRAQ